MRLVRGGLEGVRGRIGGVVYCCDNDSNQFLLF